MEREKIGQRNYTINRKEKKIKIKKINKMHH